MFDKFLDGDVILNRLQVWRQRLSDDRAHQFVCLAEDYQNLVGSICAYGNEDSKWGSYIDNMHVAHEWKRKGIGTALMKETADWLQTHFPQSGVYLWVMPKNEISPPGTSESALEDIDHTSDIDAEQVHTATAARLR